MKQSKTHNIMSILDAAGKKRALALFGKIVLVTLGIFAITMLSYHAIFWNRIYPGVVVAEIYLGGKTQRQAVDLLGKITPPQTLIFTSREQKFTLASQDIQLTYDPFGSANSAFRVGRQDGLAQQLLARFQGLGSNIVVPLTVIYDENRLETFFGQTTEILYIPAIEPEATIENGKVLLNPGKTGQEVNKEELLKRTLDGLRTNKSEINIPVVIKSTKLTREQSKELENRAQKLVGTTISFVFDDQTFIVKDFEIIRLLLPERQYKQDKILGLVDKISSQFSRPVQNPTFRFENGRVQEFKPAKDGIDVDEKKLTQELNAALKKLEGENPPAGPVPTSTGVGGKQIATVPVQRTKPTVTTGDVNTLGIRELVGRGSSRFRSSIPSRAHNISLAASRLNGMLILPGETFSFNKALGDVSMFTGYQQAYIIKDGKTILGDGGGVCQVSSTLFRAAINAGLPISERRAHSYRVAYYEQDSGPGLDATVYDPTVDLKIKNDTSSHILIQTTVDTKAMSLIFELYGTNDGRISTISKSRVWDVVPAPSDLYQDDPTLPTGTTKQIDFKAMGAKVAFDYKVVRTNEVLQNRTFYSTYRPWQAVYLRGIAQ